MNKLLIATAVLASFSANAGLGRADRSVQQHKEFALQSKFDFACHMNAGSATLIDPFWVITADHVSGAKSENYQNRVTCSSFEKDEDGVFHQVKSVSAITDPNGEYGEYEFTSPDGRDFALVRLDTPITGIKPAKLPVEGMFDPKEHYKVNQIGYGNYNGRNGGTKYVYLDRHNRWVTPLVFDDAYTPQTDLQWHSILGDSGSGITVEKDGEFYLLGEIGIQIGARYWFDTFENTLTRLDFIKQTMQTHGFSYVEEVKLDEVKWTPASPENSEDYHAYFSYWKAESFDFNGTGWYDNGGIYATAYATPGERYSIEFVVPKQAEIPAFDLIVDGRIVAANVDVNSFDSDAIKVTVNEFELKGDAIKVEMQPVGNLEGKGRIALDYFAIK
ncbi:trypsin-like serine peptidase [Vibrio sp. 16]|uniref:trypsin-like serine peptidase n=1 Tax=Vibrio sp. 16 TaxID=391586 RepID=UPI002ACC0656|nr:trypsin-like serine protease [Vibrio sp. 16]CAK4075368.1 hypothetical protein VDT1_3957 [Vibrio sp. 16]